MRLELRKKFQEDCLKVGERAGLEDRAVKMRCSLLRLVVSSGISQVWQLTRMGTVDRKSSYRVSLPGWEFMLHY